MSKNVSEHDLATRVESHPLSVDQQEHDANLCLAFFADDSSPVSKLAEDAIFRAAGELANWRCKQKGVMNDRKYRDRWVFHYMALLVQNSDISGITDDEIDALAERVEVLFGVPC